MVQLTDEQRALADQRARSTADAAAVLARQPGVEFVSLRDVRAAARQAGVEAPDGRAERDMVRAAGFGRFKTATLLGDWEALVSAANESARWHGADIDLVAVSRASLAWCLAGRPADDPIAGLLRLSRDVVIEDVHREADRPTYRQLLDGWQRVMSGA